MRNLSVIYRKSEAKIYSAKVSNSGSIENTEGKVIYLPQAKKRKITFSFSIITFSISYVVENVKDYRITNINIKFL